MEATAVEKLKRVLVTGGAGFIGSHLVDSLLAKGVGVTVLDNFDGFYDPATKERNVESHLKEPHYRLVRGDLRDSGSLDLAFGSGPFDVVVHLAALAGVRPSMNRPVDYMDVNVVGTQRLIERVVSGGARRLVFGSSSSVYGQRSGECFLETDRVDQPLSPYAASKVAGEAVCYAAHHTAGLPVVCLRFFTVFGPRQRPDLAIHKFCRLIEDGHVIEVFGDGSSKRDYTFVADIVRGVESAMTYNLPGFDLINLGRSDPVLLLDMIRTLERALGKLAKIKHLPMQTGDMPYTYASIDKARSVLDYDPATDFTTGVGEFVRWFREMRTQSLAGTP